MKPNFLKRGIRGGQVLLHNFRMFRQIVARAALAGGVVFILISASYFWLATPTYHRYLAHQWIMARLFVVFDAQHRQPLISPQGEHFKAYSQKIIQDPVLRDVVSSVYFTFLRGCLWGFASSFLLVGLLWRYLMRYADKHSQSKIISGDRLATAKNVKAELGRRHLASDITLAGLPIVKGSEYQHFLFSGTTGTGKSTGLNELLDQARERGDRVIIVENDSAKLRKYFRAGDVLLNCFDERGQAWHLWDECPNLEHFSTLAEVLLPMPIHVSDPFWINASRQLFAAVASGMRHDPKRDSVKLLNTLFNLSDDNLQNYLRENFAEMFIAEKAEKMTLSIKAVMGAHLRCLRYVKDEGPGGFSIRQWIQDDSASHWLFISTVEDRSAASKPLISAWLDIAINALLSLSINSDRRIWIILDELADLNRLPNLEAGLRKARKFGGCFALGWQNISGVATIYGRDGANSLSGLLNTRLFFRQPDSTLARWSAEHLGHTELLKQTGENISYGANTMRDGVSISRFETKKPVVTPSEIMRLDDLTCFIRLKGNLPICQLTFKCKAREDVAPAFIPCELDEAKLQPMEALIKSDNVELASKEKFPLAKLTPDKNTIDNLEQLDDFL